jgi:tRNA C32,U32 (ribose-2'-O)-methylase TrmJ
MMSVFFYPQKKTKGMFENIQAMFMRSSLSKTEIQTLWGMIKKLRKQP